MCNNLHQDSPDLNSITSYLTSSQQNGCHDEIVGLADSLAELEIGTCNSAKRCRWLNDEGFVAAVTFAIQCYTIVIDLGFALTVWPCKLNFTFLNHESGVGDELRPSLDPFAGGRDFPGV